MCMLIRPCAEKSYVVEICKPGKGSVVINKLQQNAVLKRTNGKDFFSSREMKYLRVYDNELYCYLLNNGFIVNDEYIVKGFKGELYPLSLKEVKEIFDLESSGELLSGQWISVTTRCRKTFAEFVPLGVVRNIMTLKGIKMKTNNPETKFHGKGDFIIYGSFKDGTPNFYDMRVVSGELFKETYENKGWEDCLIS